MFDQLARRVERAVGSPWAFMLAAASVVLWLVTGPLFGWSDTWQLICNTFTTVVTFLIVFLIQATQSRDTRALHLKIDEVIRVLADARNELIVAEEMPGDHLDTLIADLKDKARDE